MEAKDDSSILSDEDQEITSLQEILDAFGAPLNEEQAWALCYQCGKYLSDDNTRKYSPIAGASGVLLAKDGSVCIAGPQLSYSTENPLTRQSEGLLINSLGRVIYNALDYGLSEEEERELSHPLERLIEFMTVPDDANDENTNVNNNVAARGESSDSLNVDEGIVDGQEWEEEEDGEGRERLKAQLSSGADIESDNDRVDGDHLDLQRIPELLKLCACHLPQPGVASTHYQAVCRAVYAEYQDLATFLRRISGSKEILRDLFDHGDESDGQVEDLQPRQWAKIWLNVVRELRDGVKLKKLSGPEKGNALIEYALTPYEMLMDDIRSRRYSLNKVMVDGRIPPQVKKEAHDIVLDFIRSRPPLKPVPKDRLRREPLHKETPHEMLMNEIRSQPDLRPVPAHEKPDDGAVRSKKKRLGSYGSDVSDYGDEDTLDDDSPLLPRKVLKAEFTLDWSEEESESEMSRHESDSYSRPTSYRHSRLLSLDDEEDDGEDDDDGGDMLERAIQKILEDDHGAEPSVFLGVEVPLAGDTQSSTPKTLTISQSSLSSFDEIRSDEIPRDTPRRHSVGPCQTFKSSCQVHPDIDCLSLTVEEVVHIRSVLVKAEIENLRVDARLYKAVLQDKVCFSCKKKFSLFQKKFKCRLCKRLICNVCCVKMFIPKEEFLHIPLSALSPASPKKSPATPVRRRRSSSDPPSPFLPVSPKKEGRRHNLHLWRKPTPVEDVCCECCNFLKNSRTGPPPTQDARAFPTPFTLAPPPLQKMNSLSSES